MTKICLECATPRAKLIENGFIYCGVCKKNTHTVDGTARRPLCHDCVNFKIKCQDQTRRPALNYGKKYLSSAKCDYGQDSFLERRLNTIAPFVVKYGESCGGFKHHHNAPNDGRPNPLSPTERREWREYLESPTAFWLDPNRWQGIADPQKQKFWDKKTHQPINKTAVLGTGLAIAASLFFGRKAKSVDKAVEPATPEQTTGDQS